MNCFQTPFHNYSAAQEKKISIVLKFTAAAKIFNKKITAQSSAILII